MALVLIFPYLPLGERATAGEWELIPSGSLVDDDVRESYLTAAAGGLMRLYEVDGALGRLGVIARQRDGKVGDDFTRDEMRLLRRAVLVALLAGNPSLLRPEEERSGNEGHLMATSDNAIAYGHPIAEDGYVSVEYGFVATTLAGGFNVHRQEPKIAAPLELHAPLLGRDLDAYYANAACEVLAAGTSEARRLGRAIDWLDLAWRNTTSLNIDLRIVALRTAFEVLFDTSDTMAIRQALSALLDPEDATREERRWRARSGREIVAQMSDLEWWFTQLAGLRNAIAHGDELQAADYEFEVGQNHLWLADARLRESMAEIIARAGYPEVRLEPGQRALRLALRESGLKPNQDEARGDGS